ncbi:MAG: FAD-binding oxidoreductase [Solirubrobacteraceae bacterium]
MASPRPSDRRTELSWSGWGDPNAASALPEAVLELLRGALGITDPTPAPSSISGLELTPVRLAPETGELLARVVGEANASSDHEARARHALGKSTLELLALRAGETISAPDLVLAPGSHEEIIKLLELCSEHRVAVVPFGGGTSVVGGLTPDANEFAGVVAVDLRRLNALLELDQESRLAVLGPGLRGPEAEALLADRGYTIGHFPQSFEFATLGGFAAARSSGQASAGYGRFDELVAALKVATPAGTLTLGRAPKSAAGPDLRQLMLGSEGTLGVITELTIRVKPVPERRVYEGWRLNSFDRGAATLRRLVQDGPVPTVLRLSDEAETALGLARPAGLGQSEGGGCLAIVGYEGTAGDVQGRRAAAGEVLRAAGASPVEQAGEAWARDRYRGPYLRDSLLDAGALVETLETATFWSSLGGLYEAVGTALRESLTAQGTPPVVLCHISHVYPDGGSLYFTVASAQLPDPIEQWRLAKAAASEAIVAVGASITHHHGVGRDHREWLPAELGQLGVAVLDAVKQTLDPAGILNPGVLFAPR